MENIDISQRAKLQLQILQMKTEKSNREDALNQSFSELKHLIFVPAPSTRKIDNEPPDNKRALLNLTKTVINRTTDYVVEQKFGEKRSFNEFLTAMFIEIVSAPYINRKIVEIFSEIRDQIFDESDENN